MTKTKRDIFSIKKAKSNIQKLKDKNRAALENPLSIGKKDLGRGYTTR